MSEMDRFFRHLNSNAIFKYLVNFIDILPVLFSDILPHE